MYNAQHNLLPWSPDDFSLWYLEAFSLYLLVSNPLSPPHHSLPSKRHPHGSGNHSHHPAHFQTGCKKVYSLLSHQYSHSLPFIKYRFTIKTEPLEKSIPALKLIWTNFILQLLYGMKNKCLFYAYTYLYAGAAGEFNLLNSLFLFKWECAFIHIVFCL